MPRSHKKRKAQGENLRIQSQHQVQEENGEPFLWTQVGWKVRHRLPTDMGSMMYKTEGQTRKPHATDMRWVV